MIRIDLAHPATRLHATLRLEHRRIPHREDFAGLLVHDEDAAAAWDALA